jgi:alkaline phosphatase
MKQIAVIIVVLVLISCHGEAFFMKFGRSSAPPHHASARHSPIIKRNLQHFHESETSANFWREEGQNKLKSQLKKKLNENVAKNVILFLGDGMSISTITASRIYEGQLKHKSGEENSLSFENFDHFGISKPYCVDMQTADSACSATAYFTGVKNNYATIGVTARVELNDCKAATEKENRLSSFIEWAQNAGKATGIVTTTRITHASPAGAYAKTANRDWESDFDMLNFNETAECQDIALQLISSAPGKNLNVIYGGGRKKFKNGGRNKFIENKITDEFTRGERLDGRDLIDEWLADKRERNMPYANYIHNRSGLVAMNHSDVNYVLGLFADSHLSYHLNSNAEQPTLKEMTISAVNILKKNKNGFVLFVEGGRIDQAHHDNQAKLALDETIQFSDAVRSAVEMTDEKETLIVVTADHSHTMSISGYSSRGGDILGMNSEISDIDNLPYMTLQYANGPSGTKGRAMPKENDMSKYTTLYQLCRQLMI